MWGVGQSLLAHMMAPDHNDLRAFEPRLASSKGTILSLSKGGIQLYKTQAAFAHFRDFSCDGGRVIAEFKQAAHDVLQWGHENIQVFKAADGLFLKHANDTCGRARYYVPLGETRIHRVVCASDDLVVNIIRLQSFEYDFSMLSQHGVL